MSKDFMKTVQDATNAVQAQADAARAKHTATAVKAIGGASAPKNTSSVYGGHPSNAYPHQTDNSATSSAQPKLNFQNNLLDAYDVVTYHWKLFIVTPAAASTGNVLDLKSQVVIAETGVTDLTIDKVEIRTVAAPIIEIGTGTSTNVTFEIIEPSGAALLDQLFYKAVLLGIGNWSSMPFYLQLEFRGRDPETSNSDATGKPGALANLKWVLPVSVTNIKADVTSAGTRYNFVGQVFNELGQVNAYFNMPHSISLSKLDNFGTAMTELEGIINLDQFIKTVSSVSIPDVYKIIVDPTIAYSIITPVNNNKDPARANSYVNFTGKTAMFNANTSVDKIIDTLLSHTERYQTAVIQSKTPGGVGSPSSEQPGNMRHLWRIVTETRPIGYDSLRGKDAVEITIFVIDYALTALSANIFQAPSTKESSIKRFITYVNRSILRKKYNYIFTGLNDQVIALNLTFNNAFATARARFDGIYVNSSMASKGVVNNTSSSDERAVTEKLVNYIRLLHNPGSTNSKEILQKQNEFSAAMKTATLDPSVRLRLNTIAATAKPADARNYLNNAVKSGGTNLDGSFTTNTTVANAKSLAVPLSENLPLFVSDLDVNSSKTIQAYADFLEAHRDKMRPSVFTEQPHSYSVGPGIESNSNTGVNKLASIFSVALHSGIDANLVKMKLTIKGDPFWMAPGPVTNERDTIYISRKPIEESMRILKSNQLSQDYVNFNGTDNFIVIRFRSPRISGVTQPNGTGDTQTNSEMFSGVYKVVDVIHKFELGKFVQDLSCILDPDIKYADIAHLLEADDKKPDVATTVEKFKQEDIPASSQPTSRIMGAADELTPGIADTAIKTASNAKGVLTSNTLTSVVDSIRGQTKNT